MKKNERSFIDLPRCLPLAIGQLATKGTGRDKALCSHSRHRAGIAKKAFSDKRVSGERIFRTTGFLDDCSCADLSHQMAASFIGTMFFRGVGPTPSSASSRVPTRAVM